MNTLYIECKMGAAGDMLMAALLDLLPEAEAEGFLRTMNALGLPGVAVRRERAQSGGLAGSRVRVTVGGREEAAGPMDGGPVAAGTTGSAHGAEGHAGEGHGHAPEGHPGREDGPGPDGGGPGHPGGGHAHRGLADIQHIIEQLPVSPAVRQHAAAVYGLIAQAEAEAHGRPVDAVHFHEVGALDAVADVVGVCLLIEALAPQRILASPVSVGGGRVRTAHGLLPVPAPATALLLRGIPSAGGPVEAELCTPTGAALLRHFVAGYGPQPPMAVQAIGLGLGTKEFEAPNCLRAFWGEEAETGAAPGAEEAVAEVCCNLDDMTGEALGFAQERLWAAGALDVYLVPLLMKKNRPGQMLCCLCKPEEADKLAGVMLRHTTSFGVRIARYQRRVLARAQTTAATPWGEVALKTGRGEGIAKTKPEYEDLARIARQQDLTLDEVAKKLIDDRR